MPIEIIIPQFKIAHHIHICPYCRKAKYEENSICQKNSGDHKFPCVGCLYSYRRRFGSLSDDLLDVFMAPQQREMVKHVAPDKISDDLDERDRQRSDRALSEFFHGAPGRDTLGDAAQHRDAESAHASAAAQKERYARVLSQAEVIKYEEVIDEIEEMKKKEGER